MNDTPTAKLQKKQNERLSSAWLVPAIAIVLSAFLFIRWELSKGPLIKITFDDVSGITIDSPIMYRGAIVGRVEDISLLENNSKIIVNARLEKTASGLATQGSTWWIVRPSVSLQGVSGLDTIIGPRYIQVLLGDGEPAFTFEGSSELVPIAGTSFSLISDNAEDVAVGTPIYYRGIEIGTVTTIELSQNVATVRINFSIQDIYSPIVRTNSKFWNVSGISLDAGLTGISLHAGPLTSLIRGGVTMATPNTLGEIAPEGYGFELLDTYEDEWLEWSPEINLHNSVDTE